MGWRMMFLSGEVGPGRVTAKVIRRSPGLPLARLSLDFGEDLAVLVEDTLAVSDLEERSRSVGKDLMLARNGLFCCLVVLADTNAWNDCPAQTDPVNGFQVVNVAYACLTHPVAPL